ncbi:hypothetical protein E2C01_029887 [Portunus trituberculatus]|uniref:Uncharacterized protein n=1 Tax=Portunus trituberculatus TaxID=210409 RepID=A0A5B7ETL6_PORTR|nr:hypothetical protein [Portunus trituberculatus]
MMPWVRVVSDGPRVRSLYVVLWFCVREYTLTKHHDEGKATLQLPFVKLRKNHLKMEVKNLQNV